MSRCQEFAPDTTGSTIVTFDCQDLRQTATKTAVKKAWRIKKS